ncbi:unnamed protein product [marine sediment metagenome]|uniref:Uncharacterized protein n=1 Tax=marine sediment metagenome TaxID=412755 RepID=X1QX75_9ZZZZ
MSHNNDDFLMRMCREAADELAHGNKTWREIETNTLFLACVGMVMNHMTTKIARPLWFFAGSVFCALVGWGISVLLGG